MHGFLVGPPMRRPQPIEIRREIVEAAQREEGEPWGVDGRASEQVDLVGKGLRLFHGSAWSNSWAKAPSVATSHDRSDACC